MRYERREPNLFRCHYARTPTRIDLAGGWTDVPRFAERVPGAVLNFAINLYSHVRIRETSVSDDNAEGIARKIAQANDDERVTLYSVDFGEREVLPSVRDVQNAELTGNFGLVKAALRRRPAHGGMEIFTRSDAPPGSGLGTSASMGVALVGALNRMEDVYETPDETAETAVALETDELGILSGKQDHYVAALGGVQYMTFHGGFVRSVPIPLDATALADLQRRIVLVYTGKSRLSSDLHRQAVSRFESGDPAFLGILDDLARAARDARDALLRGDIDRLGKVVGYNWERQREIYDGIATPQIEELGVVGLRRGAIAVKACGAGGGGCLAFVCEDGSEGPVAKALRDAGAEVLRYDIAREGLLTWSR
jgi:D-glycero-alpha-D-manno-heptose-7-phosphate kinase